MPPFAEHGSEDNRTRQGRGRRRCAVVAGCLGLGAVIVGIVAHGAPLPPGHPDRAAALTGPSAAVHVELERLEAVVPAGRIGREGLWSAHLGVLDGELARGRVDVAVRVWHDAYGAALESRTWEGMIAVGDAFMRIGRATQTPRAAHGNAREAYLTALIRARRNHSVEGALRSAEAFGGLGDRAIVDQCLHVAAELAAGDEQAQQAVSEVRQRWAPRQASADF